MTTTRFSFVAAPALMGAYGIMRLIDHHSRLGWTFGHLLMVAGLVLFVPVVLGLRRRTPSHTATAFAAVGLVGIACLLLQFGIDIVVGLLAADADDKSRMFDQVKDVPGVVPVVYAFGPILLYVGLIALTTRAAIVRPRPVPWWTPVLVVAGTVSAATSLDLIPVAALCYLLALAPLTFGTVEAASRHRVPPQKMNA